MSGEPIAELATHIKDIAPLSAARCQSETQLCEMQSSGGFSADSLLEAVREVQKLLRWQKTTTSDNVFPIMREFNIDHAYRLTGQRWGYYMASALQLHNESLNWLSHFAGGLLILGTMISLHTEIPDSHVLDFSLVWTFALASTCLHFASAFAHLLHSKSELMHCLLFFVDNAAAGISAMAGNFGYFLFTSSQDYFSTIFPYILPFQIIGSILFSSCYSFALARYKRSYNFKSAVMMFGATGIFMITGVTPMMYRTYLWLFHGIVSGSMLYYITAFTIFSIGVIFYVFNLPERFKKGYFDIFGHSHQWFHLGVTISHYLLIKSIVYDIKIGSPLLFSKRVPEMPIEHIYWAFVVVFFADVFFIFLLMKVFDYDTTFKSKTC